MLVFERKPLNIIVLARKSSLPVNKNGGRKQKEVLPFRCSWYSKNSFFSPVTINNIPAFQCIPILLQSTLQSCPRNNGGHILASPSLGRSLFGQIDRQDQSPIDWPRNLTCFADQDLVCVGQQSYFLCFALF